MLSLALAFVLAAAAPGVSGAVTREDGPVSLVPVGRAVGVKLFMGGVLVVGLSDGASPAKESGLREGDVMLAFNGVDIESAEHLQQLLRDNGEARTTMSVRRGAKTLTLPVEPEEDESGVCHLGAWIRDSMAGIGTMTFYDPATGRFGALGHGVTDVDTGALMPIASGAIMDATVKAVKRGESGAPGELRGDFDLTHDTGTLSANTDCGIFGHADFVPDGEAVEVARHEEIRPGKAVILANCTGDEVHEYEIEIEKVYSGPSPTRNLLLHVTDPELLARTGGIVQGMSGAPILQNGKLVGAVTHVLVNDATRGYGIFMENMLAQGNFPA